MDDVKQRSVQGGFARLCGQVANLGLRLCSLFVLARLLDPKDFGLVAMVTAVTGVYELFTNAGLSSATIQKGTITYEQISTLFWINLLIGVLLASLCLASAPVLVAFYGEPSVFWVTVVMAVGFIFNAAGVQHVALMQRQMRYVVLALIETISVAGSIAVGITMAFAGWGYWALVALAILPPAITTLCAWVVTGWIPQMPSARAGTGSMLRFGGIVTLNGLVVYVAYNLEKVLLGRFWGADALGIYGRAYQLINIPNANLNGAIGMVAFAGLSRLQGNLERSKTYFLRGYSLLNFVTVPTTIFFAIFSNEIVSCLLGSKWADAAPILRLLAPTILVFGVINPLYWFLLSRGLQLRSLTIAFVIAPIVWTSYVLGLPYGPVGVAAAYSIAMTLWVVPHVIWCLHGTNISAKDLAGVLAPSLLSGLAATPPALVIQALIGVQHPPFLTLVLGGASMLASYLFVLLFIMGQKDTCWALIKELRKPIPPNDVEHHALVR